MLCHYTICLWIGHLKSVHPAGRQAADQQFEFAPPRLPRLQAGIVSFLEQLKGLAVTAVAARLRHVCPRDDQMKIHALCSGDLDIDLIT